MLHETLAKSAKNVLSGYLKNEAQVKQAVIVPILRDLGWDDTDPTEFLTEYAVDTGSVDFALFVRSNPLVFVEAKRLGNLSRKAEEQLFNYANNKGIPLLVLTDGQSWDFYLSMAAGQPSERCFLHLKLSDLPDNIKHAQKTFQRYLGKEYIASGKSRQEAEQELKVKRRLESVKQAIPEAWKELLSSSDDLLVDLLIEKVNEKVDERLHDTKPLRKLVEEYLHQQITPQVPSQPVHSKTLASHKKSSGRRSSIIGFCMGTYEECPGNGKSTLIAVLKMLQSCDSSFYDRFYNSPSNGRVGHLRMISQDITELGANSKYWHVELGNGWWSRICLSTKDIRRKCEDACEVAGLKFGTDLVLIES